MDVEFHYYITALLAHSAGFNEEESKTIAYSAQYIDDNDIIYEVRNETDKSIYKNYVSQTFNILKPKRKLMRIYPVFHFIPGDPNAKTAKRKDNRTHLLNTTPNSEYANKIIDNALESEERFRTYRIGIASHSYIDSWAHQNFIGWYSSFNHIKNDPKPNIGHADAEGHPDWVAHEWVDERLVNENISNLDRFNEAAESLFKKYCKYQYKTNKLDNSKNWDQICKKLQTLQGNAYQGSDSKGKKERIEKYLAEIPWLNRYDETEWFNQAIDTKIRLFKDSHNEIFKLFTFFKDKYYWRSNIESKHTHWFKFQESIRAHQSETVKLLEARFKEAGLIDHKDF